MASAAPSAITTLLGKATPDDMPTGPLQHGRGKPGQYVYWITFPHPTDDAIQRLGLRPPTDFDRDGYSRMVVAGHKACGHRVLETATFQEPHASGKPHLNCLVRASAQYRWKKTAEHIFNEYKVRVNFAPHIKTWAEGIVYGRVASEHKPPEMLDQAPTQWAENGMPMSFEDVIPRKWKQEGFIRRGQLTPFKFLELCREHTIRTEPEIWALATDLEKQGDKGLLAFLMENEAGLLLERARKAMDAKAEVERAKMTRLEIMKAYLAAGHCTCPHAGQCYDLMKDVLAKNGLDGVFQKAVVETLVFGRQKMRNLCVLGASNQGKSFLLKPLLLIFKAYTRPEGGTYQLEDIIGAELVFLNDFEFDESTKKWMPWQYFKNFLEGAKINVARPKNRGGNMEFTKDAPVFMTAPQEVALYRGKRRDECETEQMNNRIAYFHLHHTFVNRIEAKECGHCGARVYLEGVDSGVAGAASGSGASGQADFPLAKKPRLAVDVIQALKDAKDLKDAGLLTSPELQKLKDKLFDGY